MADSSTNIPQLTFGMADKETQVNLLFDAASPSMIYGRNGNTSGGLNFGLLGGRFKGTTIADSVQALTASTTSYIEADATTGTVTKNTTGWTAGKLRLYKCVTNATAVTSYEDHRMLAAGTMSNITDKQGKVLDDLIEIEDAADIDTTFAVGGYIIKEDAGNVPFSGATMLVSANGGVVSQLISVPITGKIGLRRYEASVWGDLSFTIAPTDVQLWYADTTASAADAVINADGTFSREVSSAAFKREIEPMQDSYADALLNARPVFYRSKCAADPKDWSYWGFIAEELAEIDPRLVRWGHAMKAVEQPNGLPPKMVEDKDSPLVPIGVQYSRLVVPLLQVVKRQGAAIEALTARLDKLEGKV